jgi:hypothetical protein
MNKFLESLSITFRRDPTNFRPRINKLNSVKVLLVVLLFQIWYNKYSYELLFQKRSPLQTLTSDNELWIPSTQNFMGARISTQSIYLFLGKVIYNRLMYAQFIFIFPFLRTSSKSKQGITFSWMMIEHIRDCPEVLWQL